MLRRLAPALSLLGVLAVASGARADIAPPDSCNGAAGTTCQNAGPDYKAAGVCTATKCTRTVPGSGGGAPTTMMYDCVRCMVRTGDGGADPIDDSDGCAYAGARAGSGGVAALALAYGAFLAFRRRRR